MGSIDRLEMLSASESLETPSIDQSQRAEPNKGRWRTQLSWEQAFGCSEAKTQSLHSTLNQFSKIWCCVLVFQCLKISPCHIFTFCLKVSYQTCLWNINCSDAEIGRLNWNYFWRELLNWWQTCRSQLKSPFSPITFLVSCNNGTMSLHLILSHLSFSWSLECCPRVPYSSLGSWPGFNAMPKWARGLAVQGSRCYKFLLIWLCHRL